MKVVKLGEVVELFNGSTPLKTKKAYWENGDIPWFTVDDLRDQGKYIRRTNKFITKLGLNESSLCLIPEDAVLLCCTASVGAIAINKIMLTTNQQFNALVVRRPNELLVEYLYYWFLANMDILKSLGRATTIDYVSMSKLRNLVFHLPSLESQREIVEKLDSAFAEIELSYQKTTASLEFISSCFDSFLDSILQNQILKCGESKLVEVLDIARGGSPRPIDQYLTSDENGVNWIKISDATSSKKYITETAQKIRLDGVSRSRLVNPGDFLLSNSMSFGRPYIMRTTGCIHDGWLVLSNNKKLLNQDYLYYVLGSKYIYEQFNRAAAGSTVRNLNISLAGQVTFPVPDIETQESIVSRLIDLEESVDEFKEFLTIKLNMLAELKNSLLSNAFDLSVSSNAVV